MHMPYLVQQACIALLVIAAVGAVLGSFWRAISEDEEQERPWQTWRKLNGR